MSWTSEFETPPSRPPTPSDEPEAAESAREDGPLDPSVFDGLFADLDEADSTDAASGDEGEPNATPDSDGDLVDGFIEDEATASGFDEAAHATVDPETAGLGGGDGESDLLGGYQNGADIEGFESITDGSENDGITPQGWGPTVEPAPAGDPSADGGDIWGLETTGWGAAGPDTTSAEPSPAGPEATPAATAPSANGGIGPVGFDATALETSGDTETDVETIDLATFDLGTPETDQRPDGPVDGEGQDLAPTVFPIQPPVPSGDDTTLGMHGSEDGGDGSFQDIANDGFQEVTAGNGSQDAAGNGSQDAAGLTTLDPTRAGFDAGLADLEPAEMTVQDASLPAQPTTNTQDGRWIPADGGEPQPAGFDGPAGPTQHETVFEAATEPTFAPAADATPPRAEPEPAIDFNLIAGPTGNAPPALDPNHEVAIDGDQAMTTRGEHGFQPAMAPDEVYQPAPASTERSRRWPSFIGAILVGALLGGALALVLYQLIGRSDQGDEAATTAAPNSSETAPATDTSTGDGEPAAEDPAVRGRLDLNSIRFRRGTTDLTPGSVDALDQLADAMIERPGLPLLVVVRSYSEPLAADNLALSQAQAAAVIDHLAAAGADISSVQAVGVGTSPLSSRQPVQNFVIVDPGFGEAGLSDVMTDASPFAIGIDPTTGRLRPESLPYLERLGEALNTNPGLRIGLAGYSFDGLDPTGNRQLAGAAVDAVTEFLSTEAGIVEDRVSTLSLADAQFIVPQRAGNHISIQWGEHVGPAAEVAAVDQQSITFESGTDRLTADGLAALDQVAEIVAAADGTIVIDAHAFATTDRDDNQTLSEQQAAAAARYLVDSGVAAEQIRAYGSGSSRQFRDGSSSGRLVLSFIPR